MSTEKHEFAHLFSERFKSAVQSRFKKYAEFADAAGIPYRTVQEYLAGNRLPGADALSRIVLTLGLDANWLLGIGDSPMDVIKAEETIRKKFSVFRGISGNCDDGIIQDFVEAWNRGDVPYGPNDKEEEIVLALKMFPKITPENIYSRAFEFQPRRTDSKFLISEDNTTRQDSDLKDSLPSKDSAIEKSAKGAALHGNLMIAVVTAVEKLGLTEKEEKAALVKTAYLCLADLGYTEDPDPEKVVRLIERLKYGKSYFI